jgi:iron complex transport system ATP-binding protein
MSLFSTRHLSIGYSSDKPIQQDINISLEKGQIISLMGQNGVGKTTFLKTIAKLIPGLKGDVYFGESALDQLDAHDLSTKLSLVLTERPSAGNLSVVELVASGRHPFTNWLGRLANEDHAMIEWALAETQINYIADKKLSELSDGQLQKAMIARALAQNTDMIFLDEPTAHLDLHNKIEIMMLLRKIASEGKGILISTHDLQISLQLSDKMWLFNFVDPVTEGIPEDLILNGSIEKTLYLSDFNYDFKTGRFNTGIPSSIKSIAVEGDSENAFWTRHALEKVGFTIDPANGNYSVTITQNEWHLHSGDSKKVFNSIEELLAYIA